MLRLANVDSFYGRSHILHGVDLDVPDREITTVLGRNGTGKTTLLKTIMGLTDRMTGEIRVGDVDLAREPTFRRARAGFAYVPQGREIVPDFTIRQNILMGAFARPDRRRLIPEIVAELFPYLINNLDRTGGVLSGGQQQQLSIARALAADPKVLLLDEPTAGMTQAETHKTSLIVNNLKGRHTIVVVEHDMAFVREIAERITVLHLGQVLAEGNVGEIENNPRVREAYLGSKGIS